MHKARKKRTTAIEADDDVDDDGANVGLPGSGRGAGATPFRGLLPL